MTVKLRAAKEVAHEWFHRQQVSILDVRDRDEAEEWKPARINNCAV